MFRLLCVLDCLITLDIIVMCISICAVDPSELVGQPIETVINHQDYIDHYGRNRGYVNSITDTFCCKRGHVNKNNLISISPISVVELRPNKTNFSYRPRNKNSVNRRNLVQIKENENHKFQDLKFAVVNARSIANKLDKIKHIIYEDNIDVLALTEKWI